jgi:hypothetical protein
VQDYADIGLSRFVTDNNLSLKNLRIAAEKDRTKKDSVEEIRAIVSNLSASSPPIVQVMSPTLESPVKVGVGLVNTIFSKTLATAMRLILKLVFDTYIGRAIRKISLYNGEDNDPVPTAQDYTDIGRSFIV